MRKISKGLVAAATVMALSACGADRSADSQLPVSAPEAAAAAPEPAEPAAASPQMVSLPRLALACGGDGYRNYRLVFDPAGDRVLFGSVADGDGKGWISSSIAQAGGGLHILFQGSLDHPTREMVFNPDDNTYEENSNYKPGGAEKAEACYASIRQAEADCAEAANLNQCMELRYPREMSLKISGACMSDAPRWQAFECDVIDDYEGSLEEASAFELYDF